MRRKWNSFWRRNIAYLLTLAIVLLGADFPAYAGAAERAGGDIIAQGTLEADSSEQAGGSWQLTSDGTLTVSGAMPELWPESGHPWGEYTDQIQKAVIGEGVTCIMESAFSGCGLLTDVTIPGSVTTIGQNAFAYCTGLESISIPDSVERIKRTAFVGCTGLKSIIFPENVSSLFIDYGAFNGCTGLEEITVPDGVGLGEAAFSACTSLKSAELSASQIGTTRLFAYCSSLTDVTFREAELGSDYIGNYLFQNCTALEKFTIPETVSEIGWGAFSGCSSLKNIMLPKSVNTVGQGAFAGTRLSGMAVYNAFCMFGEQIFDADDIDGTIYGASGSTAEKLAGDYGKAFKPLSEYAPDATKPDATKPDATKPDATKPDATAPDATKPDATKPDATKPDATKPDATKPDASGDVLAEGNFEVDSDGQGEGRWKLTSDGILTIIGSMPEYGDCPWEDYKNNIQKAVIETGVRCVTEEAFSGCQALKSVTIPDSVETIGDGAFQGCTGLADIIIPDGVTHIGRDAFRGCKGLENITIPDKVTMFERVFKGCTGLRSAELSSYGDRLFENCTSLTNVKLREETEMIVESQFRGCTALKEITIPQQVYNIDSSAFAGCSNLSEINVDPQNDYYRFEDGILYFSDYYLAFCTNKRGGNTFSVPEDIIGIYDGAFSACTALEAIEAASGNEWFASQDGVLYDKDRTALLHYPQGKQDKSFTVPDGVETVKGFAFFGCGNLKNITFPESVKEIEAQAFLNTKLSGIAVYNASCMLDYIYGYDFEDKHDGGVIYGHPESTAKRLAEEYGMTFKPLSELPADPQNPEKPTETKPQDPDSKPSVPKPSTPKPSTTKPSTSKPAAPKKLKKPGTCKVKSLRSKKKKATLKWGKVKNAYRYQVSFSTKKNANGKKYKTFKTSYKTPKLKKGKTYYFKVRASAYKRGQKEVWGKWSKVKKVKIR